MVATVPETLSDWMKDHVKRYLASNGADGHMLKLPSHDKPVPTLLLTTTGRKSGEQFLFPLIYGTVDNKRGGKSYVVIASKGGAPDHPGWYKNLVAHPAVELQVADKHLRATARTVGGDERTALWAQMAALFPPYD
ncbi:MAG: nitroreductase family deazaflavin-dependent oxidoreductase, partial [Alphaproteobacteria bacterium]|nr:nitroreductase family deazaflavin-dependent oxidoreductase [Alphaproteobacteria bacterium]